jgi:hypothetical protein
MAFSKRLRGITITEAEWNTLIQIREFLTTFKLASKDLEKSDEPTINMAICIYNYVFENLEQFMRKEKKKSALYHAAKAAHEKLKKYYSKTYSKLYNVSIGK